MFGSIAFAPAPPAARASRPAIGLTHFVRGANARNALRCCRPRACDRSSAGRFQEGGTMASTSDAPVDLYIAAYDDPDAARSDWDAIKELAGDDVIKVDGLV